MASFNLIHEPWIPCIDSNGNLKELGLLDVLRQSHQLREISHQSPLVTASLHRLLLAILHRNFGPEDLDCWFALYQKGQFDDGVLDSYFENWKERFDLFHPERPFYQSIDDEVIHAEKHSLSKLAQEMASGNNDTLFDHTTSIESPEWSAANAARYVVATQSFAVGGGVSKPFPLSHAVLVRGSLVLLKGKTLFETFCLNLVCCYGEEYPETIIPTYKDIPSWEQDEIVPQKRLPYGYLDLLTIPARRLKLNCNERGKVDSVQIQQGVAITEGPWLDPMLSYVKKDEQSGWIPLRIKEERALWRDSSVLIHIGAQLKKPAETVCQYKNAIFEFKELKFHSISLEILGFKPDDRKAAKINIWRHERFPLPIVYLKDENTVFTLERNLTLAEETYKSLHNKTLWFLASDLLAPYDGSDRTPDRNKVTELRNSFPSSREFWARLEPAFYDLYLGLPNDIEPAQSEWAKALQQTARDALEITLRGLDGSARSLQAAVKARRKLSYELKQLFPEQNHQSSEMEEEKSYAQ
ncbi:MAG: type I-E CRISPR-associated protein Cse1/CasA [Candidatus Hinthialibacter antarcticus]|nr:type I-E CRISPR-associated protein Cse1/CasA [Candidatus Hinthialibacter antarcticus]